LVSYPPEGGSLDGRAGWCDEKSVHIEGGWRV
jgi:hypothetical protein